MLDASDVSTTTAASTGSAGSGSGSGSDSNPTPPAGGSNYGATDQVLQVQHVGSGSDICDPDDLDVFLMNCDSGSADVDGPERG
jgi:hypothetical protein